MATMVLGASMLQMSKQLPDTVPNLGTSEPILLVETPSVHPPASAIPGQPADISGPQELHDVNNFSLAKMLCLVNDLRSQYDLYPVVYHNKLLRLAQEHAQFESSHQLITHNDGAGQIGDRLTRLGFQWTVLAENVGAGASDEVQIMKAWTNSPRHLANILHPTIRYLGVGVSNGYWVQDFAAPMNSHYTVARESIESCPASSQVTIYT
ncbi:hypothetical protein IWW36_001121 [Coemansia brasiliensis]|uniref:SCP domain-containing protein n=1 Tax=Coemansia brasiliensis TaxID=2650707 RepID=A0A9W8ICA3_9FUNG|nr:hypothetical protein IWW36_001121 [Coemansia brasiliensis]